MAPYSTTNNGRTSNQRKRKIEIKEVEQKNRRRVTFSKRKLGLFNKLTELSLLCKAQTALIITSENGNVYSCGYPNTDAVLYRYVSGGFTELCRVTQDQQEYNEKQRLEYENVHRNLKEKHKQLEELKEAQKSRSCFDSWWNLSHQNMSLEDLEEFKTSLETFKFNLITLLQEKETSLPLSMASRNSQSVL
ncbi:hypothetical protein LR48_Vigan11g003700 [Vigna angularis]|uniref:Agamous-like MADS-box protein n=1 Tax=Phaseolus angularis TaxID=3914 RepID=A0A0L9VPN6_PHAAN|nr:agamous-like MADS-box protein AGL29 [Vigna angularis]KAG2380087.1 Agamous-like MADS-box protein [Vigna angularis]KOM57005.1 hypothetical protein LR48_Vigan11g003700 [Vigna angularis]